MLKSRRPTADELRSAITDALTAGVVTRDEILDMVSTVEPPNDTNGHTPAEPTVGADHLPIYTELPEGLIDLPTATVRYECGRSRLHGWVQRGLLTVQGRLKGAARGGGYLLVSETDLQHILSTISVKGGRPRKDCKPGRKTA